MRHPQYLLRFDDICPTMNWWIWAKIEPVLIQHRIKPILAVVPDNRDPSLQLEKPAPDFWDRVRAWQDRGWTIALHGYQHLYVSQNAGLAARRKLSEFAGLPARDQREKLQRAMDIFERERIATRVWIAPGNTFDATTVALLPEFGINVISAGWHPFPYASPPGMIWMPQQMHYFRPAPSGVWTVCYHHNQWNGARTAQFRMDLDRYGANVASLEDVLNGKPLRESRWSEWLCTHPRVSEFLIRGGLKLWSWCTAGWRQPGSVEWRASQLSR